MIFRSYVKHISKGDLSVTFATTGNFCIASCTNVVTKDQKDELDKVAVALSNLVIKAANKLVKENKGNKKIANDAKRAVARSKASTQLAFSLTLGFPDVTQTCADAPPTCAQVDNGPAIEQLNGLIYEQEGSVRRFQSRSNFNKTGKTIRGTKLVKAATALRETGAKNLAAMPRFQVDCSK